MTCGYFLWKLDFCKYHFESSADQRSISHDSVRYTNRNFQETFPTKNSTRHETHVFQFDEIEKCLKNSWGR